MLCQAKFVFAAALVFTASRPSAVWASVHFSAVGAGLTAIPTNIPANATHVDLSNNAIETADVFLYLPSLVVLNLAENLLVEFPNLTFASKTLQELTLSHNHIRVVNPARASLVEVTTLYFDDNALQEFPDIRQMASLQILNLNKNNITWIAPDILASLTYLTDLLLADNRLASLPDVDLPMFHLLNVDANPPLTELPILKRLGRTILCLVVGQTDIPPAAFSVMDRLNYLELNSTSPTYINSVAKGCPWLKRLNLVNKNLTEFPAEVFALMTDLRSVEVEESRLESIPEIPNGTLGFSLSLSGNPLVCDSRLQSLVTSLRQGKVKVDDVVCASPTDLSGVTLREWAGAQPMHKARYVNDQGDCVPLYTTKTFLRQTVEDCAVRCTEDVACTAFSYNFGNKKCGLVQLGARKLTAASVFGTVFEWY